MLLAFVALLLVALRLGREARGAWLDAAGKALARVEEQCLAGTADWCPPGGSGLPRALVVALAEAWDDGLPLAGSIGALRAALADGAAGARTSRALLRLWLGRVLAAWVAVGAARAWLAVGAAPSDDGVCLGAATILLITSAFLVRRSLPTTWLGRQEPSGLLTSWLAAHLGTGRGAGLPIIGHLDTLADRELTEGISRQAERRALLATWAREQALGERQRLQVVEELLPAFELVAVGLPVALALVVPIVRGFAGEP